MQDAPSISPHQPTDATNRARTHVRWWFCLLAFLATMIIYSDRQFLSLLKPTLAQEIHWTDSQFGFVSSCFLGAYALGLIFFGWFIDRVGVRTGYAVSLVLWSIAEGAHALLGSVNGFVAGRIFLGITEGGNFPAAVKVIAQWFPKSERALATALFNSGANVGAVGAPFFIAWLLEHGTWRSPFCIAAAAGIVWVIVWLIFYSHPQESRAVSPAELAWIEGDQTEEAASSERIPWLRLLTLRQTWSFVIAKFMTDPVWFFLLIWLPDYFKKTRDLDIKHSWPLLVTVYSIVTILSVFGGWVTGYLVRSGWTVTRARKTGMFCFALLVVPILAVGALGNWPAVCLLGLAGAAHQAWSANLMTTVSDMFPKRDVGSVIGLGSTGGALGSMAFIYLCGVIVQSYGDNNSAAGYHILFIYCACAYLIAFFLNHLLARRFEPIHLKATE